MWRRAGDRRGESLVDPRLGQLAGRRPLPRVDRQLGGKQQAFVRDYTRLFGGSPDHQSALSYDAAMLIGRAAHAVGPNRRKVRDWIAQVGRNAPPHHGATGVIRFDEHGDATNKTVHVGRATR
jgi:ABC-type branched-subunit amino acid transport system substrate-binding protein